MIDFLKSFRKTVIILIACTHNDLASIHYIGQQPMESDKQDTDTTDP